MKKIEFENYSQIFDEYIGIFKNHEGINDICWSGTVSDPGISDLDIILIIDSWKDFKPSLRILNPERISKIFYHGPIICNKKYIKEFFSITNLNIFRNFNKKNIDIFNQINNNKFDCFIRQIFYFNNFKNLSIKKNIDRSILLNLKSIVHSFNDMINFDFLKSNYQIEEIREISNNLRYQFKKNNYQNFNYDKSELISDNINKVFLNAEENLNIYFNNQITKKNINNNEHFQILIDKIFDKNYIFDQIINNMYVDSLDNYRNLLLDNVFGNIETYSFIKGADFIISSDEIKKRIGKMIWLRRINKKILNKII